MIDPTQRGPWLAILGLGEDGLDGLTPAARRLLDQAELVVGGKRHLALIGDVAAEKLAWPSPLTDAFPAILARRGRPVAVLASGDPFSYGVGSLIARHVAPSEYVTIPAPSAFSLAASRVGWAVQDCALVTLHGRAFEKIIPHLQPGRRILILSWDGTTPGRLAEHLCANGMGRSRLIVLEAMGGARERVIASTAKDFDRADLDPLNTVAIEVVADAGARVLPLASGLPDALFDNDGQITKREIRAVTMSRLAPRHGELLWDVGAGTGSIAIEWMLADPTNRAIAIEPRPDRLARIAHNAALFGVPDLGIVEGFAPAALDGLPRPNAIFLGGGGSDTALVDLCRERLLPGGRLVINAVTIETQAEVIAHFNAHGGDLVQLSVARAVPLGRFHGFRPAMPIVQWAWEKPGTAGTVAEPVENSVEKSGENRRRTLSTTGGEPVDDPVDDLGDEPVDDRWIAAEDDGDDAVDGSGDVPGDGRWIAGGSGAGAMTRPRILAIGVGCRSGVPAEAIAELVEAALDAAATPEVPAAMFTLIDKRAEAGIAEAAARLGFALIHLPREALAAVADRVTTRSERVVELFGVPSIAEASALAGAGAGGRLVVERMAARGATVAIALGGASDETNGESGA